MNDENIKLKNVKNNLQEKFFLDWMEHRHTKKKSNLWMYEKNVRSFKIIWLTKEQNIWRLFTIVINSFTLNDFRSLQMDF